MLRLNSKRTRENIKAYIIDNASEEAPTTWEGIKDFIVSAFDSETAGDRRRMTQQERFTYWCGGLPSALNTCYYYNRSAVDDLGAILEESEEEKSRFTEAQAEEMLTRLIYRELFF